MILKIKPDTEAWVLMNKIFTYHIKWIENKEHINNFLGFEMDKTLYYATHSLTLEPKAVKDEWKDQFKKNSYPAVAKSKSKINKQWIDLCNKLELEVHKVSEFSIKYGLIWHGCTYHSMDEYYVEIGRGTVEPDTYDWAEVVSEADFLRIKADFIEKQEKEKVS